VPALHGAQVKFTRKPCILLGFITLDDPARHTSQSLDPDWLL